MIAKYGKKSLMKLADKVDPRLVHFAMELERQSDLPCDLTISETSRTIEEQKQKVKDGYSKTLNSKHVRKNNISGLIEAVDIVGFVDGHPTWDDNFLSQINLIAKRVIKNLGYDNIIECGCDWKKFIDKPHYQITKGEEIYKIEGRNFKISPEGINMIKEFEGLELEAYYCPAGVLTIGYGTTSEVEKGEKITEDEAEEFLREDLTQCENQLNKLVSVDLTQGQVDALVSFIYNLGAGNLKKSTLLEKLNKKDYDGAEEEFIKWNKVNGKVLKGLTRRREAEKKRFSTK